MTALRCSASIATALSMRLLGDGVCGLCVTDAEAGNGCEDGFDHFARDMGVNGSRAGCSIHEVAPSSCAMREGDTGVDTGDGVEATDTGNVESRVDSMTL